MLGIRYRTKELFTRPFILMLAVYTRNESIRRRLREMSDKCPLLMDWSVDHMVLVGREVRMVLVGWLRTRSVFEMPSKGVEMDGRSKSGERAPSELMCAGAPSGPNNRGSQVLRKSKGLKVKIREMLCVGRVVGS